MPQLINNKFLATTNIDAFAQLTSRHATPADAVDGSIAGSRTLHEGSDGGIYGSLCAVIVNGTAIDLLPTTGTGYLGSTLVETVNEICRGKLGGTQFDDVLHLSVLVARPEVVGNLAQLLIVDVAHHRT